MHLTRIFNEYGLFKHIGGWIYKYKQDNKDVNPLNEFLFRASSAFLNINRMDMLSINCINQYKRQKLRLKLNNQRLLFWSPTVIEIMGEISPYLSTMRILQNDFFKLSARVCNPNATIPKSLNDAMKKGLDTYGFSEELSKIFTNYWNETGRQIKNYRDMDQHYYSMVKHSYIQTTPAEKLLILLPDNPENKSTANVKFEKKIDAINYLKESFFKFHDFVEETASLLEFEAMEINNIDVEGDFNVPEDNGISSIALVVLDEETGRSFEAWVKREDEKTFLSMKHHAPISIRPITGVNPSEWTMS